MKTWAISWRFRDYSGSGLLPWSFTSFEAGNKILLLLELYGDGRAYTLHELEVFK